MANIADCGVAIAKKDLDKLGIKKTDHKDGYESIYTWEATDKEKHVYRVSECRVGVEDGKDSYYEHTFQVNEQTMDAEEYYVKWQERLFMEHNTCERLVEKDYRNGWKIDWKNLKASSYQSDVWTQEYDDHLTIYFGGRWGFPSELEDTLNNLDITWQGAVAEDGCEVLDDTIGNTDFGLRVVPCGDGQDWHCVEDTTSNPL